MIDAEDKTKVERMFNNGNAHLLVINQNSYMFKAYKHLFQDMTNTHEITLVSKWRNNFTYKYNRCYTAELGVKKRCENQCEACRAIQSKKEDISHEKYKKWLKDYENKVYQKPSKFQQIIKIIFNI